METRMLIAYGLMGLLVLLGAWVIFWLHQNSRPQVLARQRKREKEAQERRSLAHMEEKGREQPRTKP
ncbi:MAG: hypothetical protein KDE63_09820 [Novosphingobium sp.]|nr:hypothetical protein [Novosphingobium sp.]